MRRSAFCALSISSALAFTSLAPAQFDVVVDDGVVDYRTRGELAWSSPGWISTRYAFDKQGNGIGPAGIAGLSYTMTDENCSTLATSQFALFEQDASLPAGAPGTFPDAARVLFQSAVFLSPSGPTVPCTWLYTVTFPTPLTGVRTLDLFPSAFLDAGPGWNLDGPSGQCSTISAGTTPEVPNLSPNPTTRSEIDREYGLYMLGGTGPALVAGSQTWPFLRQAFLNRLVYSHSTRAGARDTTGFFAARLAVGPDNFGWADYPDAANRGGHAGPSRADDIVWEGRHDGLGGTSAIGVLLLETQLVRNSIGTPLNLGFGVLELDPTGGLFNATASGVIPGLLKSSIAIGREIYVPTPGLQQSGLAQLLHAIQANLYCQELRVDLQTGQASLGSLDSHSFRL